MRKIDRTLIIFLCIVSIFLGKVVRYTIMKESLVDYGIGHYFIVDIVNKNNSFGLTLKNDDHEEHGAGGNTNFIFEKINFLDLKTYEGFEIYISFIFNFLILLLIGLCTKKSFSLFQSIFIIFSVAVLNIWDFCLAKEPIQMLYFLLMFYILRCDFTERKKFYLIFGIYVLSALTFRNYYMLIGIFLFYSKFILNFIANNTKSKYFKLFVIIFSAYLFYLLLLVIVSKVSPIIYSDLLCVRLRTSPATTVINTLLNNGSNMFIFVFDYILIVIRMFFPIELVRFGPKYILYFIYQIMLGYYVIRKLIYFKKLNCNQKLALYIYIAFLLGSATFEPDFGSWVRHEAVLFPIMLYLGDFIKDKENIYESC